MRTALSILLPVILCAGLLGAIYFTLFDWEWIAFLSGIFVAAVLSLSSRATNAEWRVMRRTRQLSKLKEKLAWQTLLYQRSEQVLRDLHGRLDLLANSVPAQILYMDTDQVCRSHNQAVERALGLASHQIDGQPLREILGAASYGCAEASVESALKGVEGQLRQLHNDEQGSKLTFDARYIPHRSSDNRTLGFYAVLTSATGQANNNASLAPPAALVAGHAAGELGFGLEGLDPTGDLEPQESVADIASEVNDARARTFLQALQTNQFCMFQQPIVSIVTSGQGPSYHEILVRLRDEEKNLIHPGAFLGIAEDLGLMPALDRWVVENLLRWYGDQQGRNAAVSLMRFNINLSSNTVRDELFPAFVRKMLASHGVRPDVVCFEISEADVIAHRMEVLCSAHALQMLGCHIAIDGFGRASRSFSDLKEMPLDFVKIDGSIIGRVLIDPISYAKAKAISEVTRSLGARTIAECVEDAVTLERLRRIGVDYAQGFGIAMPEPIERLETHSREVVQGLQQT